MEITIEELIITLLFLTPNKSFLDKLIDRMKLNGWIFPFIRWDAFLINFFSRSLPFRSFISTLAPFKFSSISINELGNWEPKGKHTSCGVAEFMA